MDGYHSYLLANAAVDLHLGFLNKMLRHFPGYARYFDLDPDTRKRAEIVVSMLTFAENLIIRSQEGILAGDGCDVLLKEDVDRLKNRFIRNIFDRPRQPIEGKVFVDAQSYGIVFRPSFNRKKITGDVDSFIDELSVDARAYGYQLKDLRSLRAKLARGDFDVSQAFYDALGDIVGHTSSAGFLKLSRGEPRAVKIGEKGVDGDFAAALAFDACDGLADVFVLLTNDADHAPVVERMSQRGMRVAIATFGNRPSWALRRAAGPGQFLSFLTDEREFDWDPIWLLDNNRSGWTLLEDMRNQWLDWKRRGMIEA